MTQYAYPDALSALHGLFAILCALDHRDRTGEGQCINLSQFESTVAAIGDVVLERLANDAEPPKLGNRSRQFAPQGCYPCLGEDRWIAISVDADERWQSLCRVADHPEWSRDLRFTTGASRLENADDLEIVENPISLWLPSQMGLFAETRTVIGSRGCGSQRLCVRHLPGHPALTHRSPSKRPLVLHGTQ